MSQITRFRVKYDTKSASVNVLTNMMSCVEWGKFLLLVETEVADMEFIYVILVIGGKIPN